MGCITLCSSQHIIKPENIEAPLLSIIGGVNDLGIELCSSLKEAIHSSSLLPPSHPQLIIALFQRGEKTSPYRTNLVKIYTP